MSSSVTSLNRSVETVVAPCLHGNAGYVRPADIPEALDHPTEEGEAMVVAGTQGLQPCLHYLLEEGGNIKCVVDV